MTQKQAIGYYCWSTKVDQIFRKVCGDTFKVWWDDDIV